MTSVEIGRRFDNRPLMLPWAPCPHILVAGETGAGKSGTLNAIIGAIASDPNTAICGIDLKLVEQWPWRDRLTVTASTTHGSDLLLAHLRRLIRDRAELLKARGLRMWDPSLGPWVAVVIDELAELAGLNPELLMEAVVTGNNKDVIRNGRNAAQVRIALLGSLARLARFCGVTIIAATQYPSAEVVDQQIRTQLTIRIMLRVASGEQVDVCLGRGYGQHIGVRSIPVDQRGGLWIAGLQDHPEPIRARAHYVDDHAIASRNNETKHLRYSPETLFGPLIQTTKTDPHFQRKTS